MTFRKIDTCIWKDPWFENLNPTQKLAFIYFWSNDYCNAAGIYEISENRIKFDIGYGIDTVWEPLKKKIEWYPEQSTVWVKNFFKHQAQNYNFAVSAIKAIKCDPFKLQVFVKYNSKLLIALDTLGKGYGIDMVS